MELNKPIVVTPSNVNGLISRILKGEKRLANIAVRGEITNLRYSSTGHCFFSISDGVSKLSAAVWKSNLGSLKVKPEENKSVVCYGGISTYENAGTYCLSCYNIELEGEGEQAASRDKLVEKLKAEGLFAQKRPLPAFPKKIAVITSPTGAVVHDIEKTLQNRFPCVKMLVIPAVVQGENAPLSIARGIEFAQTTDSDVLIIGRGGGATEDLSAFDSEIVARALYASKIPTISAVGHEIDITIADIVADRTAATPTAAAVAAVPDKNDIYARMDDLNSALLYRLKMKIRQNMNEVLAYKSRMNELLERGYTNKQKSLDYVSMNIKRLVERKLTVAESNLEKSRELISALNPLSTLKRGYSIVQMDGKTITDARELKVGGSVEIMLKNGGAVAVIEEIRE